MNYRPSVRMDITFRNYINDLFHATSLDRNQLIRAALFVAGHSEEFKSLIDKYRRHPDVPLPAPSWQPHEHGYWMEQSLSSLKEGSDVSNVELRGKGIGGTINRDDKRRSEQTNQPSIEPNQRREGSLRNRATITNENGGIQIRLE